MTTTVNQQLKVVYVVLGPNGVPFRYYDLSPSGFVNRVEGTPPVWDTICIPIDPITALKCRLAMPYELGLSDAFAATLALLNK